MARYRNGYATCRACGDHWPVASREEGEAAECPRCKKMLEQHPDLAVWISDLIDMAIENHASRYKHEYHDWD